MNQTTSTHLHFIRVEGENLFFNLHGRHCCLVVEEHMRRHIVRERECFEGFSNTAGAPDAKTTIESYHPELHEMNSDEWAVLVGLFAEDIVVSDEGI